MHVADSGLLDPALHTAAVLQISICVNKDLIYLYNADGEKEKIECSLPNIEKAQNH